MALPEGKAITWSPILASHHITKGRLATFWNSGSHVCCRTQRMYIMDAAPAELYSLYCSHWTLDTVRRKQTKTKCESSCQPSSLICWICWKICWNYWIWTNLPVLSRNTIKTILPEPWQARTLQVGSDLIHEMWVIQVGYLTLLFEAGPIFLSPVCCWRLLPKTTAAGFLHDNNSSKPHQAQLNRKW